MKTSSPATPGSAVKKKQWSSDRLVQQTALNLTRDFQENLNDPDFCKDFSAAILSQSPSVIRKATPATNEDAESYLFKAQYQLQSIFKRHTFKKDVYSKAELESKAVALFLETQQRILALDLAAVSPLTEEVLKLASVYIAETLGEYCDVTHRALSRFGSRASVGIPARKACEAERWELPISGTSEQIKWFDAEMRDVRSVQEYWTRQIASRPGHAGQVYTRSNSLKLTLVPKTFKSLRAIMPNTTIGSYMSYGLGELMRLGMKRKGYDIRRLQHRHKCLAEEASVHNLYTTADLSSASDSISVQLVERLFPSDWVDVLHRSRASYVSLPNGLIIHSETFGTMGVGYTFPLQTLVFLSLLKAIEATMFNRRVNRCLISVYGDDMIYDRRLHPTVLHVFQELGFVINNDKTFHEGPFRESCGGDYHRGMDVRPFQPQNGPAYVFSLEYEAMLYKYINCLLMRWSEHEIGRTLNYLAAEVEKVSGAISIVPYDFPDDSGVKCSTLRCWDFLQHFEVRHPVSLGHGVLRFSYLRLTPHERREIRHEPYLWARLRGIDLVKLTSYDGSTPEPAPCNLSTVVDYVTGADREVVPALQWRKLGPDMLVRTLSGKRLRRLEARVVESYTGSYSRQSGTSCFGVRR